MTRFLIPPNIARQTGTLGEPPKLQRQNAEVYPNVSVLLRMLKSPESYIITNVDEPIRLVNGMSAFNILFADGTSYDVPLFVFEDFNNIDLVKRVILSWKRYSETIPNRDRTCIFCYFKAENNAAFCTGCYANF